jgi:hypothetical protein
VRQVCGIGAPAARPVRADRSILCVERFRGGAPAETQMSKGMDRKKETKKKPLRTPEEKRALKREKKANRGLTSL